MRRFYVCFPIATTLLSQLSWSHYLELIKIEEENKRNFYLKEAVNSKWSVRELQRQKNSLLYERLALSQDKTKVLELAEKGQIIKTGKDLVFGTKKNRPQWSHFLLLQQLLQLLNLISNICCFFKFHFTSKLKHFIS